MCYSFREIDTKNNNDLKKKHVFESTIVVLLSIVFMVILIMSFFLNARPCLFVCLFTFGRWKHNHFAIAIDIAP